MNMLFVVFRNLLKWFDFTSVIGGPRKKEKTNPKAKFGV
jgi:hypothetical protein